MTEQHKSGKRPRLFYYEESEGCWTPVPDEVSGIIDLNILTEDGDYQEITFKRIDMTDDEFAALEVA